MEEIKLGELYSWFRDYVHSFYSTDTDVQAHVRTKEEHTEKVVKHSAELAKKLHLNKRQQQLAEIIGLFHDIGRFKQYTIYRTFNDSASENHAELGLREIARLNMRKLLTPTELECFNFAIRYHNAIGIPQTATEEQRLYATIIRDADKLDIYRVLSAHLTPPAQEGYSPIFIEDILLGRQSLFTNMKTPDDRKLVRLCWIYDIKYAWTLEQIVKKQYIEEIFEYLPRTRDLEQVKNKLNSYIENKIRQAQ